MTDQKNNTGNRNSGNRNSGNCNAGNRNSGNCNSGSCNSGSCNSGSCNSGNWNSGNCNAGNWNSGNCNAGNCNSGNCNSGNWNSGDCNAGYFNAETPEKINVFDVLTDRSEFDSWDKPDFIYFSLTEWVEQSKMTEKEKEENENYGNAGGYLKRKDYREAFKESYDKTNEEDRRKIFNCPNFCPDKFFEISGIDVRIDNELQAKKKALIEKANELLKQAEEL